MLDIKIVRERADFVKERLATRGGGDERAIDEILALDEVRRARLGEAERLKAQRNAASKEIGALMAQKKAAEAEARKAEVRTIGDRIAALDREVAEVEAKRDRLLLQIPNLPARERRGGADRGGQSGHPDLGRPAVRWRSTPKSHVELCESLRLVDFARGAKLSGSGFLLYTGWGARLERALIQFMLDLHVREHGFTEVSPPFLVGEHCMVGVGQFPKFATRRMRRGRGWTTVDAGKLYLVPTAEAPVANIHREEILPEAQLPIRYVAYSPCFRAEAGAAGVGTRGMIRVHQFDKVELIKIVKPEDGYAELEAMVGNAERILQMLGLHYRVIGLCTGDMGFASAKTYDIELVGAGAGGVAGGLQLFELRGLPGASDEPAVQGRGGPQPVPAHPQRQRHRAGAAVRRPAGDPSAGRRLGGDP
jgi:seryl-tRNA synthetase